MVDVSQGGFGSLAAQEAESTAPWAQMQTPNTFQGKDGAGNVPSVDSTIEVENPDSASDILEGDTGTEPVSGYGDRYDFFSFVDEDDDDRRKKIKSSGAEDSEKFKVDEKADTTVEDYYNTYHSPLIEAMQNIMDNPTADNYDAYMKAYNSWANDSPSAFYENIEQNEDQMGRYNEYTKDHPTVEEFRKRMGDTLWPAVKQAKAAAEEKAAEERAAKGIITNSDAWKELDSMRKNGEITDEQYSQVSEKLHELSRGEPLDAAYKTPDVEIPISTWEEWKAPLKESSDRVEEEEDTDEEDKKGILSFLENLSKNNVRLSLLLDAIKNMTDEQLIEAGYTPDAIRIMRDTAASSGNAKDFVSEEDASTIYSPDASSAAGAMNVQSTSKNEEFNAGQEKQESGSDSNSDVTSDENMKNIRTLYRNQPHIRRMWKNLNDKKSSKK